MIRRRSRGFYKLESRVFCPCELCRLRFGRLLYPKRGGSPLGLGWRHTNAIRRWRRLRIRQASAKVGERVASSAEARAFYDDWGIE